MDFPCIFLYAVILDLAQRRATQLITELKALTNEVILKSRLETISKFKKDCVWKAYVLSKGYKLMIIPTC